jgi:adenylate cyclase
MLGQLVPCGGGPPIPLLQPKLLVGRQDGCDIPLRFPTISGRHCELELREHYWFVRDLGSKNGTRVNGKLCTAHWLLPHDVLTVAYPRYQVIYTPPASCPPPVEASERVESESVREKESALSPSHSPPLLRPSAADDSELGELIPCGGGDPIPLRQAKLVVGRHPNCDIVLRFATVSGIHCQLEWTDGYWFVRDLGSRHGIRVDGVRCQAECVKPGSVLWIADQRYRFAYLPQGAGPPPASRPHQLFMQGLLEAAGLVNYPLAEPSADRKGADDDEPRRRYTIDD